MTLKKQPKNITIIGSGAIGIEFAFFYNSMGSEVTVIEYQERIIPNEDKDISSELMKIMKKKGITFLTSSIVLNTNLKNGIVNIEIENIDGKKEIIESEIVLSAVGVKSNIEDIGLEELGINVENEKIVVDQFYKTHIEGFYAIGDVISGQSLAHVASAEGIICIEKIAGLKVNPLDYT